MSNVVSLRRQPTPIAHVLRVTEHKRLDQLLEADKLPYTRFVIEAGDLHEQRALPCEAISAVPESVRARHFLDKDLTEANRRAPLDREIEGARQQAFVEAG